jgi:DNA-binding transcriptional regulator YhcF (GntR family)
MNTKEKAEEVINQLRAKGYSDDDIAAMVMNLLTEMNSQP